jgi:hypothetical protein
VSERSEVAGVVLGLTGAAVGIWGIMAKPVHEVRGSETTPVLARDVRHGEVVAGALTVLGGAVASQALGSPWPVVIALAVAGIMVWELETGLMLPGQEG